MKEVSIVGHAAYDYIFFIDEHPQLDESSYIMKWRRHYGGGAANIAVGIAKLGGKSRLIAAVGNDFKAYENYLKKVGVKLSIYKFKGKTARAFIFNGKRGQVMYFYWGVATQMQNIKARETEYLHIAPCHPKLAIKMAEKSKFFAFDPGQDIKKYSKEEISYIAEKADIIFCNEKELKKLENLINLGNKEVIVTLGKKGSMIYKNRKRIEAIRAKQVDVTGAGDAYKSGFWVAFLKGYSIEDCCKIGSIVASYAIQKEGAQNFPTWNEVMKKFLVL